MRVGFGHEQNVSRQEILADYPELEPDDVRACLAYARAVIANDSLESVRVASATLKRDATGDLEIINAHTAELNAEAEDVLSYQVIL